MLTEKLVLRGIKASIKTQARARLAGHACNSIQINLMLEDLEFRTAWMRTLVRSCLQKVNVKTILEWGSTVDCWSTMDITLGSFPAPQNKQTEDLSAY